MHILKVTVKPKNTEPKTKLIALTKNNSQRTFNTVKKSKYLKTLEELYLVSPNGPELKPLFLN